MGYILRKDGTKITKKKNNDLDELKKKTKVITQQPFTYENKNYNNNFIEEESFERKKSNGSWFDTGAFDDGYQFGDISKTILGTGANVVSGVLKGTSDVGFGTGKLIAGGVAQAADWLGQDEWANKVRNRIAGKDEETNKRLKAADIFGNINEATLDSSVLGTKGNEVSKSIGQIAGYGAASAINPVLGSATMFGSSAGESLGEAYSKEDIKNEQAWTKALVGGGISVATERLFGLFGKSGLDTAVANKISSKLTSGMSKELSRLGVQATSEATEELLEYAGNQLLDLGIDAISKGEGAKFHEDWNWEEVGQQMATAAVASGIVGAGTKVIGIKGTEGSNLQEKINNYALQEDIQEGVVKLPTKSEQEINLPTSQTIETIQEESPLANLQKFNEQQREQINQRIEQEQNQEINKKIDELSKKIKVQEENAKGTPFNTLIGYGNDTALVQVKGNIQDINGVDVGIYKDFNGKWHVIDLQSNFSFDRENYSTKKAAIENATNVIDNFDLSQLRQNMEERKSKAINLTNKPTVENKNDYRGSHQIENAKRLVDLNVNDIQSRVEAINGYLTQQDQTDLKKLHKIFNHPEEDIKVYRASPINELNSGDWITTDRAYAKNVAQNNGGKVYEYTIKPSQLYYPDNVNELPSLHRLSSFQYIENEPNLPPTRDFNKVDLPTKSTTETKTSSTELKIPSKKDNIPMVKNDEVLKVESQRIANEINDNGTFKQKGWLKTAIGSDVLKDEGFIKDLDPSKLNYVVQSNQSSVDKANNTLNTLGYEKSLEKVKQLINDDKLPSASDVALMQRMIQEAAKRGDAATVQDLIMDTAIVGTDLGQATQALSIIQRLTPEGQLKLYTKLVQRAKIRGEKSFQNVEITPEMVENVLGAYNSDGTYDQDDLNARVEQFKQDLANQMKSTVGDKTNAWRYLAMLGNPKTHIRNIVSNLAMNGTIKVKNAMARTLETILPVEERTKTWKPASQDVKEFAKQTTANMKDIITGEAKYNEKSAIESKKQIFKNKTLEKLSNFNGNALEAEDWFFSSRAFQSTLQEYLTANGINTYEDIQNNAEIVEKAKNYAKDQAEIATFRQYSKLASTINQIEKKNKGAKLAVQALMPFKKTPINVAKAGVKYSPLGLIKSMSYDAYQLKQGNINASQFIDNLSQGLTGTSLTLLGYALAKAGILSGSGGDDKDDKYDSQLGNTGYSLNIGGNSYSISWLSPVAMPLLVGSNAYEQLEENKDWDMNVVSDTLAKTLDPLNEMSFMQGLTNALQSYGSGTDKIKGSLESTVQNYVGQFFPTIFSQLASTLDDKKRSTKASNDSKYKFGEQTVRSIMYKIPGLRQKLEVATDIWGNEKEQSDNIIERAFESFIAPYTKTKQIETGLDKELKRLYNETGETGVIPSIPYAYVKYGDETYRMSANEYTQYKKTYGQTANKLLNRTISSSNYKTLSEDEKTKVVKNILGYSKYVANKEYFDNTNVDYENKEYTKANIYSKIGNISDFYLSKAREFKADKDAQGNTISGSAKKKVVNYINTLNAKIPEKAILIKLYGNYTFNDYDNQIINYVNNKALSKQDKEEILKQLGFTIRDGRVYK